MNRERLAWIVSVALLAVLAFQLPGTFAGRDDDYAFVRTLMDIHRQVITNYVTKVDDAELKEKAIEGMLGDLDPFSVYIPPDEQQDFDNMLEGSFKGVGIQLNQLPDGKVQVVTPIEGSPAFYAGVLAGDIIEKVNGVAMDPNIRLPDVVKQIAGLPGSTVTLTVKHEDGTEQTLTMERREIEVPTVRGYSRNPDFSWDYWITPKPKIAYIRITQFTETTYQDLHDALVGANGKPGLVDQGMQGLILDLRFNPGGRLDQAEDVLSLFVDKGVIVSTKGRNRPETIVRAEDVRKQTGQPVLPYFPIVVLINEHSASAAEIVSGSLMDNKRALVMGTRSYGKGSVQELMPLENDEGELKLTVAYYYLPSGRCVHRLKGATDWGVDPQIVVPMDDAQEQELEKEHNDLETLRRPVAPPTTQSANGVAPASQPTTSFVDTQLQQAINTMVGMVVLNETKPGALPDVSSEPSEPAPATGEDQLAPSTTAPDGGARPSGPMPLNPTTAPTSMP